MLRLVCRTVKWELEVRGYFNTIAMPSMTRSDLTRSVLYCMPSMTRSDLTRSVPQGIISFQSCLYMKKVIAVTKVQI